MILGIQKLQLNVVPKYNTTEYFRHILQYSPHQLGEKLDN